MSRKLGGSIEVDPERAATLVEELQLAQRGQVGEVRAAAVRRVQAAVQVWPGNAIDRTGALVAGEASELRATGVTARLPRPVAVGSFFLLEFDRAQVDLAPVLVRCELCCMRSEDEFEVRFMFLAPVVLPGSEDRGDA